MASSTETFRAARDLLLRRREDHDAACREFRWPELGEFNWALDWFDVVAAHNDRPALRVVDSDGSAGQLSYSDMSARSNRVANWLRGHGVARGDRLILMLGNQVELWETILAAMKLGVVLIPATTLLGPDDLVDRVERGGARHVVTTAADAAQFEAVPGDSPGMAVGGAVAGCLDDAGADAAPADFAPYEPPRAGEPLLLSFTSGTTAQP